MPGPGWWGACVATPAADAPLATLLWALLIPLIAALTWRWPTHWDNWRQRLPLHLAASAAVCVAHVLGMVGLRILAYRWQGMDYEFGPWPRELVYEYLKDVRSYAGIVLIIEIYRLLLRRLQGEQPDIIPVGGALGPLVKVKLPVAACIHFICP